MDQPLPAVAKEIQWLWPDSFSNNKYVVMIEMAGRVVEWFWVASYNNNCWNSVADSLVKVSYLPRTTHAHQVTAEALHILQQSAFLSYVQFDRTVTHTGWRLNNRNLNTRLLF